MKLTLVNMDISLASRTEREFLLAARNTVLLDLASTSVPLWLWMLAFNKPVMIIMGRFPNVTFI